MNTHIQYMDDEDEANNIQLHVCGELFPRSIKALLGFLLATTDMATIYIVKMELENVRRRLGKQEVISTFRCTG